MGEKKNDQRKERKSEKEVNVKETGTQQEIKRGVVEKGEKDVNGKEKERTKGKTDSKRIQSASDTHIRIYGN